MQQRGKTYNAKGKAILGNAGDVKFNLPIIVFKEDGAVICYCPALDLSGDGLTEKEAKDSFSFVINEYFDYTGKKKTLNADLPRLGWKIKGKKEVRMIPLSPAKLLDHNEKFRRVFDIAHLKENRPDGCWSEDATAADVAGS